MKKRIEMLKNQYEKLNDSIVPGMKYVEIFQIRSKMVIILSELLK